MIKAREPVTKRPSVTKVIVTKVTGHPKIHASAAEKQRAYRQRKKSHA